MNPVVTRVLIAIWNAYLLHMAQYHVTVSQMVKTGPDEYTVWSTNYVFKTTFFSTGRRSALYAMELVLPKALSARL
jgi:hypothetical protein